ncbi:rhomboid family protein [Prosthecobacter vanneervenii]|uniref:Membrane associated rhomboid family serine protease n=1 Tax=Prosthecobacter vanneervenii TaxID=48466 RepID=A0A7W7Y998_9BACT|nr:rhomboid family intramembrane serine protease [Prosthecobacter vanneervenii]MBB5031650.1 membrane associated rhomboid family serine protease [Prosthecobacter vanneervenii]
MSLYDRDYMREDAPGSESRTASGPTAFHVILGINIAVFVLQYVFETGWMRDPMTGAAMPIGGVSLDELAHGNVWTLFSYMFVHGGVGHFMLNMMLLWFAGRGVQQLFGSFHFTMIYLVSGIAGAAAEMAVNGLLEGDTSTTLIGASASDFGLLMALAVRQPGEKITAFIYFIIPIQIRLWTLAKGLFILQLVFGLASVLFHVLPEGMKIAYFAHLGGAALGWFYARSLGYGSRPMSYASQWQPVPYQQQQRKPAMARSTASRPPSELDVDTVPLPRRRPQKTLEELMEEDVNPLLDKISRYGKDSLTPEEQRKLEHSSNELKRRQSGDA